MPFTIVFVGTLIAALAAIGFALKKHGTLMAVVASAQREAENIEALAGKIDAEARSEFAAIVARLKALVG